MTRRRTGRRPSPAADPAARRAVRTGRPRVAIALALTVASTLAACASDGAGGSPGVVPEGVSEMRETMASQRSETLSRMDSARTTSAASESDGGGMLGDLADAIGWTMDGAVDVLSLHALGLW